MSKSTLNIKAKQLRTKSESEMNNFVSQQRHDLAQAVVDLKTKEVKQVRDIRNIKKTIARALTINSERELAALEAKSEASNE